MPCAARSAFRRQRVSAGPAPRPTPRARDPPLRTPSAVRRATRRSTRARGHQHPAPPSTTTAMSTRGATSDPSASAAARLNRNFASSRGSHRCPTTRAMARLHPRPPSQARLRRLALAGAAALALVATGCAVTPSREFQHSTFEGFDVISYVPEQPRGRLPLPRQQRQRRLRRARRKHRRAQPLIGRGLRLRVHVEHRAHRGPALAGGERPSSRQPGPRAAGATAHAPRRHDRRRPPPRRSSASACRTAPAS